MSAFLHASRSRTLPSYLVFAAFGAFWGVWGASIPRIREQAGVDDAQLGVALLFIGGGALPAMLLTGSVVDRWGRRTTALMLIALGVCGVGVALTAHGLIALCAGLALLGASSGATDVAMNSMAGDAEQATGRPVLTRAAGAFSVLVVVGSLGTGIAAQAGAPTVMPFAIAAVLDGVIAVVVFAGSPAGLAARPSDAAAAARPAVAPLDRRLVAPLLIIGALGTLAFASENAHQSWQAVFFEQELGSGPGRSALAPAVFAAVVAVARLSLGAVPPRFAAHILVLGATVAAAGAVVVSIAQSLPVAALGIVLAAAGTGGLFPTLLSVPARNVPEAYRGRSTAIISTVAYLGFLLGPVYVGFWADGTSLRGAMVAVAALGAALAVLAVPALRASGFAIHGTRTIAPPADANETGPRDDVIARPGA
ncbi:MFS transporter [Dactylosporangium sp. NPDC048998]|uniref:MFS transporter n=1 Tax=Dactylosporangium sp. NPDC048998 TaxID=3363976 RepID=UPI00371831C2